MEFSSFAPYPLPESESFFLKFANLALILRFEGSGILASLPEFEFGCYYFFMVDVTCFCFIAAFLS